LDATRWGATKCRIDNGKNGEIKLVIDAAYSFENGIEALLVFSKRKSDGKSEYPHALIPSK